MKRREFSKAVAATAALAAVPYVRAQAPKRAHHSRSSSVASRLSRPMKTVAASRKAPMKRGTPSTA